MEGKIRFLIFGYYGFGNLGDEAILETLVGKLRSHFDEPEITVLSQSPALTETRYGVQAINRWNFPKIIKTLLDADYSLTGGGGLFQDTTSSRSLWYYLSIVGLSAACRTPIYMLGQGIGPIDRKLNKFFAPYIFRRAERYLVRDSESSAMLEEMGVNGSHIQQAGDLALLYPYRDQPRSLFSGDNESRVAVALKDIASYRDQIVDTVRHGLERLQRETETGIILFSTDQQADMEVTRSLQKKLPTSPRIIDTTFADIDELIQLFNDVDLIIGGRLHVLEFSVMAGTPVVGITYDRKMDLFAESVNVELDAALIDLWEPEELHNSQAFEDDIISTFEDRDHIGESLKQVSLDLKIKTEQELSRILDIIEDKHEHGQSQGT